MNGDTWDLVVSSIGPLLSGAIRGTIPLTLISFVLGLALALVVALARLSRRRLVSGVARAYISLIRGTPLLVQLFIIFYALPSLGLVIDPFPSAVVAFSLNVGGYAAETIRAAILSVPKGQWEAAATVGLDHRLTLQRVVLPQAVRVAVPPLSNTFISLVKDTSLASTIMVTELLRKAQEIAAPTYQFMTLYSLAAVIYWLICLVLSTAQSRLERRLDRFVAH
ncbi:amino acid ABC transporter permease [Cellulomonas sp. zg-ZUI222]|uniref:Amino acid ABC transporter permease n=1 Tax=Cellulomonas wangleii TaxID=2816956 RepID=A0ABX8DBD6_9CELL|nr:MULTISPECIES: amino acid ABC transporter permease [Cellulomonas]MBO0900993.1 amino acid ABC transporter permease [Cellulomonas sp. zg-ZUI22]MBO0921648.1 amino acid ABC transporter permease [Cellulomonas wangleii]MBO0925141.1 amino acid ABC transporter permease [Cellulomonas wangleii]QVI63452.1 amino acid ABC transporter permease [Cellulomonas wangleii]